jgi:CheY-like chemotaxis protein/two-component sensor histidine kinase
VNQLLDLSRLDSKSLPVTLIQGDVVSFLRYLTEAFHSYAEAREVQLSYQAGSKQLFMDYDPKKLEAIYTNLLSNALKFTPAGGQVEVSVQQVERQQQEYCLICVSDTGPGISTAQQDFIFNRFYQADDSSTRPVEGSGIGLALTKEFVHLLGGEIEVRSQEGEGASFQVSLPVQRKTHRRAPLSEASAMYMPANRPEPKAVERREAPLVLLVEDNPDVAGYLHACLQPHYNLAFAKNGQEGLGEALRLIPDIIISDVMMPLKNGFELCETLKRDTRTSHIPILLLTARADEVSRHTGLRTGADAYLTKPFNRQELNIRLQKLLELRQRLKAKYSTTQLQPESTAPPEDPEVMFLQKLRAIILEQLPNPDFRVEPDLCRAIAMSRPQLYRKLKALTGLSPSAFLRQLRMQEARRLLQTGQYTAHRVAEKTGFQDASYFSKAYQREIGESPQETISLSKSIN